MKSDTPRTQAAIDSIGRYLKNMDSEASLENALAMVNQLEKLSAQLERELNHALALIQAFRNEIQTGKLERTRQQQILDALNDE